MILNHFSNREILSFSLVNKQWNFEAKSLLKVRGQTSARIGTIKLNELVDSVQSISDELREAARQSQAVSEESTDKPPSPGQALIISTWIWPQPPAIITGRPVLEARPLKEYLRYE